ncbi:hypothetical protein T09_15072 [Trichinella sp. T9]|nr:hypothetical protein T09_15072 [Trichinella sp. T9]
MLKPETLSNILKNPIPNDAAITYASILDLARHDSKLHVSLSVDSSEKYKLLLQNSSRRNKLLRWDFKVHIRSRSSSTPIRHLSLYRPQRVNMDHFWYP